MFVPIWSIMIAGVNLWALCGLGGWRDAQKLQQASAALAPPPQWGAVVRAREDAGCSWMAMFPLKLFYIHLIFEEA